MPLASIADGRRVVITVGTEPVEVSRVNDTVRARILMCTHWGCVIAWEERTRQYVCPCHEGRFNDDGVPTAGPPLGPLRVAKHWIEGQEVVVEGTPPSSPQ